VDFHDEGFGLNRLDARINDVQCSTLLIRELDARLRRHRVCLVQCKQRQRGAASSAIDSEQFMEGRRAA
jgi:hypothetical protein